MKMPIFSLRFCTVTKMQFSPFEHQFVPLLLSLRDDFGPKPLDVVASIPTDVGSTHSGGLGYRGIACPSTASSSATQQSVE
ncbi:hypothetical protein VTN31DRAFT_1563 [Thermomyces dupontii]|uniref:uncharacterized protein n=1 Tax=Talaromyces thermophilus TaxID=28565 RepID=UPI003741F09C